MDKYSYVKKIDDLVNAITKKDMIVTGCTQENIINLEGEYGLLPCFYKIFLERIGVKAGDFKKGTWFFFDELQDINDETRNLMQVNNVAVPCNMFAFLMHQGYTSLLFKDLNSPDPSVYCYTEGETITDIQMTFSEFMAAEIDDYISQMEK